MYIRKYKGSFITFILLFFELVYFYYIPEQYNRTFVACCLSICVIESFFIVHTMKGKIVRPTSILLLSYFIVNCQIYLDLIFNVTHPSAPIFIYENLINKGALLSAISFTCLCIGYKSVQVNSNAPARKSLFNASIYKVLLIIFSISFLWWLVGLSGADFTGDSYIGSGAYDGGRRYYREVLFQTAQLLVLTYYCKKGCTVNSMISFLKSLPKLVLAISVLYIIIRLMSGDRGPAIYTMILYLFVYTFVRKRTIKAVYILPFVVVGAVVMTSISHSRGYGKDLSFREKITYSVAEESVWEDQESISPFTLELARSLGCTHVALDQIDNKGMPLHYGITHVSYLVQFLPFIGNKLLRDFLHVPYILQSSSEYITVSKFGKYYESGMGTSTIADEYLEFGVWGVVLGFLVIGAVFKYVDAIIIFAHPDNISTSRLLFAFCLCFGCLYIPRGVFLMFVRQWFYGFCFFLVLKVLFKVR